MKKNRIILLLFACAITFIGVSLFLVWKVHSIRMEVGQNVEKTLFLAKMDDEAYKQLAEFDYYSIASTNTNARMFAKKYLTISKEMNLTEISAELKSLIRLAEVNISGQDQRNISDKLFEIQGNSKKIVRQIRVQTARLSKRLANYWMYTYCLIAASCVLALLTVYTGYKTYSLRSRMEKLKKLNNMFLNNSIDVVVTCDKQGRITEFNKAAELVFGYLSEEVFNKPVHMLYANADQAQKVKEAINLEDEYKGEILNRKKNGEIFVSQLSANRLINSKGKTVGSMGVSRDITKQKELEMNFESIVNNVGDIVYSCDVHGVFTFVNQAVVDVLGYTSEELIGQLFTQIIHEDHKGRVTEKYTDQFKNRIPVCYDEFLVRKKDGSYLWIGQNVSLVLSQTHKDHVVAVYGIARNIDHLKK